MILGIFLPFFLSFNRTLVSNIPVDRFFNFFHVSNIFRIPSPSLYSTYLSRILLATVIYLCVSRSIRSAGSDVRKIFYSIENGILIHARPTLLPPIVSILRVGGRKLRISTRRPSLLDFTSRASWTKKTSSCVRLDRWFGRRLHAHKYRNVVVRTDSGTEQSPFRNTCRLASPPFFLLNQISPTCFFARRFSTDRHKSLPSLVLSLRFESIFQIIPVIPWKFSN